jgi:RNA polymerase sigma factor (sigma-70 family)
MDHIVRDRFAAIYDANYSDLCAYVRRRAHPDDVDDIVAETFTIAWRRRAHPAADARPWLFRTAANVLRNHARSRRRQLEIAARSYAGPDAMADRDNDLDLVTAWRSLRRIDQEVLALHAWEQLPDGQAAAVLGCSRATYAMRLSRAKRRLASILLSAVTEHSSTPTQLRSKESTS